MNVSEWANWKLPTGCSANLECEIHTEQVSQYIDVLQRRESDDPAMSDAADRLAQALRDLIEEAVRTAVQKSITPSPRQRPGPRYPEVDDDVRRVYEEKYGEPVPTPEEWRARRLIPVNEARRQLGGISPSTFYALVKEGELSLVKIGRRSFVLVTTLDEFIERHRVQ